MYVHVSTHAHFDGDIGMDGWMDGWLWMDGRINLSMDRQTDRPTDRWMFGWVDGYMDGYKYMLKIINISGCVGFMVEGIVLIGTGLELRKGLPFELETLYGSN